MIMTCNLCAAEGIDTQIPFDEVGTTLMKAHLLEKHDVRIS